MRLPRRVITAPSSLSCRSTVIPARRVPAAVNLPIQRSRLKRNGSAPTVMVVGRAGSVFAPSLTQDRRDLPDRRAEFASTMLSEASASPIREPPCRAPSSSAAAARQRRRGTRRLTGLQRQTRLRASRSWQSLRLLRRDGRRTRGSGWCHEGRCGRRSRSRDVMSMARRCGPRPRAPSRASSGAWHSALGGGDRVGVRLRADGIDGHRGSSINVGRTFVRAQRASAGSRSDGRGCRCRCSAWPRSGAKARPSRPG